MYKCNGDNLHLYSKRCGRHFYYSNPVKSYPIVHAAPISVCLETSRYKIGGQALQFNNHPIIDALPGFKDTVCWDDLTDSF